MSIQPQILDLSRQDQMGGLAPWFAMRLAALVEQGAFPDEDGLRTISEHIVAALAAYSAETGVSTVAIGMSGGVG